MIGYDSNPIDRPFFCTAKTCYINYYIDSGDEGELKPFIKEEVVKDVYDNHINDTDYENNRNPNFILRNLEQVKEPSLLDYNTFISAKNISETKVFNTVSEMNYYIKINTGENFHLKSEAGKTSFYISVRNELIDVYYNVGNHTYLFDNILKKVLEDKTMYNVKEILVSSDSDNFEGENIVILFLETK